MNYEIVGQTVQWGSVMVPAIPPMDGQTGHHHLVIQASEMRRERTGFHAVVTILDNDKDLAWNNLNIGRDEERVRLVNSAYKGARCTEAFQELCSGAKLKTAVDEFCKGLPDFWEQERFQSDFWLPGEDIPDLRFVLKPYILENGITIMYAGPGSTKSFLALWMGIQVAMGKSNLWHIPMARPVYYINLERSQGSIKRRFLLMVKSMRINECVQMEFLNVNSGLPALAKKIASWRAKFPDTLFILDSLSRSAMGKMVEDDTGNKTIDLIRSLGGSWFVLGHTSRQGAENQNESHLFGGIMYDCGADVMLRLASEKAEVDPDGVKRVGSSLTISKANDIATDFTDILTIEFEPTEDSIGCFKCIRPARETEWLDLRSGKKRSNVERIKDYLGAVGKATATEIASETGIDRSNVGKLLIHSGQFRPLPERGKQGQVFYEMYYPGGEGG